MLQTSYEAKTKDVWVFIETKDGKARNVGLELLNPGLSPGWHPGRQGGCSGHRPQLRGRCEGSHCTRC